MTENTIAEMSKEELMTLLGETTGKIKEINQVHDKFLEIKKILYEENILEEIRDVKNKCAEILYKIEEAEREICGGGVNNNASAKKKIERVIENGNQQVKDLKVLRNKMLGYVTKNQYGEEKKHKGCIDTIKEKLEGYTARFDEIYKEYIDKYDKLYEKIETDLLSGATTVSLSKAFKDKVEEYKNARKKWQIILITTLVLTIGYSIFIYYSPSI